MNVTTISANVRFSKKTDEGAFTTIELGAEASLESEETWQNAQANLYEQLGQQMKELWPKKANGNGSTSHASHALDHFCQEHQAEFKRFEKGESTWFAHKDGQKWCREPSK